MNRFALTSALILGLAAPAFADGKDQLAYQLGVNPANYTLAQLERLNTAKADHNSDEVAFVKAEAEGKIAPTTGVSGGQAQLAAQLGVNAADFTLPDLIRLSTAVYDNNSDEAAFVKASAEGQIVSTQGNVSEGHAMLASMLHVNPANYTTAQLMSMYLSDN